VGETAAPARLYPTREESRHTGHTTLYSGLRTVSALIPPGDAGLSVVEIS